MIRACKLTGRWYAKECDITDDRAVGDIMEFVNNGDVVILVDELETLEAALGVSEEDVVMA